MLPSRLQHRVECLGPGGGLERFLAGEGGPADDGAPVALPALAPESLLRLLRDPHDRRRFDFGTALDEALRAPFVARLEASLHDRRFRLFVLPLSPGTDPRTLDALDAAIARLRPAGSHALVSVELPAAGGDAAGAADGAAVHWRGESRCAAWLGSVPAGESARPADWRALFELLARDPRVLGGLSPLIADARPNAADAASLSREVLEVLADWRIEDRAALKLERAHRLVAAADRFDEIERFYALLARRDPKGFAHLGGAIATALSIFDLDRGASVDGATSALRSFDERYLNLVYLLATFDLGLARHHHAASRELFRAHASSWVRYARIGTALERSAALLEDFARDGGKVRRILPKTAAGVPLERFDEVEPLLATAGSGTDARLLTLALERPHARRERRLCAEDDSDAARPRWISDVDTGPIGSLGFYRLPRAGNCRWPTGLSFEEEDGTLRYLTAGADIFHHYRCAGRTAFGSPERRLERAWLLPRVGLRNHYHSLVDRLPALYGYVRLGLDWPIVAGYEPDATELGFVERLGIPVERIVVDVEGRVRAGFALVPSLSELRTPFFGYCASLGGETARERPLRLYVSRDRSSDRVLANEREVQALVAERGFEIVHMEDHDLDAQIRLAARARTIMGPHGAGLANMIFAAPDCAVIELIPDRYMTPLFRQLAVDCGHRYGVLAGRTEDEDEALGEAGRMRWSVDLGRIERVLDAVA